MRKSVAMNHRFIFGLRGIVFGAVISAFAITAVTAISTSAKAGENDIAVPADKLNWALFGEGPAQMAVLWGDPASDEYAVLLKLPPGFTPGPHSHTFAYHGVNLQGTWTHIFGNDDVRSVPAGSYVMQAGGELHNDACAGPDECILFIHQHGPQDFIPPNK
ncbi:MAG: cupin domain-containing protein [Alphaproteobacteria bacterium]|nr:cupin domain-containing protein [Alphaproteobacteria bacterium]